MSFFTLTNIGYKLQIPLFVWAFPHKCRVSVHIAGVVYVSLNDALEPSNSVIVPPTFLASP
jgi:hypothetical protein